MESTVAEKYASLERLAPTACATLAVVLPISAWLHMPDVLFIVSSIGAGLLFFLGWQATLRQMHIIFPAGLFLTGALLAFGEVAQPSMQMPAPLFYLQGLGTPALSFFFLVFARKLLSRGSDAN